MGEFDEEKIGGVTCALAHAVVVCFVVLGIYLGIDQVARFARNQSRLRQIERLQQHSDSLRYVIMDNHDDTPAARQVRDWAGAELNRDWARRDSLRREIRRSKSALDMVLRNAAARAR